MTLYVGQDNWYTFTIAGLTNTDIRNLLFRAFNSSRVKVLEYDLLRHTDNFVLGTNGEVTVYIPVTDLTTTGMHYFSLIGYMANPATYGAHSSAVEAQWVELVTNEAVSVDNLGSVGFNGYESLVESLPGNYYGVVEVSKYPDWATAKTQLMIDALAVADTNIVRRNTAGAVDLVNGKIGVICVGMSHMYYVGIKLQEAVEADGTKDANLFFINCAIAGTSIEEWDSSGDATYTTALSRITSAGHDADQVQVAIVMHGLAFDGDDPPRIDSYQTSLITYYGNAMRALKTVFPQLRRILHIPIPPTLYSVRSGQVEPYSRVQHTVVTRLLGSQEREIASSGVEVDPLAGSLTPAATAAMDWLDYYGQNSLWPIEYFRARDRYHLSEAGNKFLGDRLFPLLQAFSWYT